VLPFERVSKIELIELLIRCKKIVTFYLSAGEGKRPNFHATELKSFFLSIAI